jgi:TRAP-type mannitol/chloroaromatic compound transport system substrate-binding protein
MGGWFNKEINRVGDFKGLKIRIPGLGGEVVRRLGATPVSLPGAEIFPALQSGALDASEWAGPWNDLALGLYKVAKYYYYPGFHEPGTALSAGINLKVWESLDDDLKAVITQATAAENATSSAEFKARNADALGTLRRKHRVDLRRFSDGVLRALGEASGVVVGEIGSGDDAVTRKIYESFIKFRKKALSWPHLGEQTFRNARILPFKY